MKESDIKKTGTTTVAIVCKDGLILAADKRATAGNLIMEKQSEKIYKINDKMALTMAGTVSDSQLLVKLIRAELNLKEIRTGRAATVRETANLLGGMIYSNIRRFSVIPGISHFILGGVDREGFHVYDLFPDGSGTEVDEYVSSGSGSVMAYGVLETLFKENTSIKEGIQLAVKAINAAIQRDIGSGQGIDVATITGEGFRKVLTKNIDSTITV